MAKSGATFLRFTNDDVLYKMEEVIKKISIFINEQNVKECS
jgi:very-short-patch-repair endonuclease